MCNQDTAWITEKQEFHSQTVSGDSPLSPILHVESHTVSIYLSKWYMFTLPPNKDTGVWSKWHLPSSSRMKNIWRSTSTYGPGSSVGIATELRAGWSGIESRCGRDCPPVQTGPGAHPASCKMGTWSFPGVKCGRGVLLTTHPLLVLRSRKSRAIPLPTLWAT